ncbi:MAG: hydrolase [Christensenellales bacterium]|jgi:hypothetical protein|nr:hydrolase [Clostridiales bacterium]
MYYGEKTDFKQEFLNIYNQNIKREGSAKLLEWLKSSDFFTAPASTRFHSAFEGGLCEHSVKVYYRFMQNLDMEYDGNWEEIISAESAAIIALLHDVCKVDYYRVEYRNVKKDGVWESVPYYIIDDKLPYGHGEKSVYIISSFMKLNREEAMAINWHMGGYDMRVLGGSYSLSNAFYKHPISLLFHISDVQSTYLDEKQFS